MIKKVAAGLAVLLALSLAAVVGQANGRSAVINKVQQTHPVVVVESTTTTTIDPFCSGNDKEQRRLTDLYTFLLARDELSDKERKKIAKEYDGKIFVLHQASDQHNCPMI